MLIIQGHQLEYRWFYPSGNPDQQPPLILLHEGLGSLSLWRDFPAQIADATSCPVLAYSRYGYGKSAPLKAAREVDYMHAEALDALPELLSKLGIENPLLIGHSDGASIAIIHAGVGEWPVRALVLMAPHVMVEDITVNSIAEAKVAYETSDIATKLGRYHDDVDTTFWGWNNIWLDANFRRWNIEEYLPGIACPVLLIQGENDQYGTTAQLAAIEQRVRGPVQTVLLPRCGHSPHKDQPQATIQAIRRFVSGFNTPGQ